MRGRLPSDDAMQRVERVGRRLAHARVVVAQARAHGRDEILQERAHRLPPRRRHELGEAEAHPLAESGLQA